MKIRQLEEGFLVFLDGKPISDAFQTMEEAEECQEDWQVSDALEESLIATITVWAEGKAVELGRPRSEILRIIQDFRIGHYRRAD